MKIALIGYGKMGKTIEALGKVKGHSFPLIIDVDNPGDLNAENIKHIEAAIEFTTPATAPGIISNCLKLGVPVVSGTTGWNAQIPELEQLCRDTGGTLFLSSNFSIGVNILFAMNRHLARIMDGFPQYRISMQEVHHIHKLDAPSGTAISLAGQILEEQSRLKRWVLKGETEPADKGQADCLPIEAIREGEVKGRHTIVYTSEVDTLSLSHNALSRDAFAAGALMAAEFISGRQGVFGMQDLLKL
jgi:4-hydroxy-tetrahydrodipicolinate reductase